MNEIELNIFSFKLANKQPGSFVLTLQEVTGHRQVTMLIGMAEAQAIAIELEKIVPNRPMTHDLFKQFAELFNITVKKIVITDYLDGIFFARIICWDGHTESMLDARPFDAIAIGLRFGVPIFIVEAILESVSNH